MRLVCQEPEAGVRELAHRLGVSPVTVRKHRESVMRKMARSSWVGTVLEYDRTLR